MLYKSLLLYQIISIPEPNAIPMTHSSGISPVKPSKRYVILDALRGFALLGIAMANFPEFSLYTFLPSDAIASFPSASIDNITQWLLYIFIDGKFYTIFSLLFGIGFSIILSNASMKGTNGLVIFYRRMACLLLIGFLHLMLVWSGDILMLYALVGMTLPIFRRFSDRTFLFWAAFFLMLPVIIDTVCGICGCDPSAPLVGLQWELCDKYGITEANFAYWLHDAQHYSDIFKFLVQGSVERMWEFVNGNRYFKVLGLFLIGYVIGRRRLFADIQAVKTWLQNLATWGLCVGLVLSVIYAWSCMQGHPWGKGWHSLLYFLSVYITGGAYVAVICLLYNRFQTSKLWSCLAAPGRMALTNYIGQSFVGMCLFYGIGFGLGTVTGLFAVECIVLCVFVIEIAFSKLWLTWFRFGPLEWLWRILTYLRPIKITNF